jgi:hypothetical protein
MKKLKFKQNVISESFLKIEFVLNDSFSLNKF